MVVCQVGDPVDHRERTLQVGLYRKAEAIPAGERFVSDDRRDHIERQLETVALLRIDGEVQVMRLRHAASAIICGTSSAMTRPWLTAS